MSRMSGLAVQNSVNALPQEEALPREEEPEEVSLEGLSLGEIPSDWNGPEEDIFDQIDKEDDSTHGDDSTQEDDCTQEDDSTQEVELTLDENHPHKQYNPPSDTDNCRVRGDECAICLDGMKNTVILTECWHPFHYDCLVSWLKKKYNCPTCLRKVDLRKVELYWVEGRDQWETLPSQGLESVHDELVGLHT